MDFGQIHQTVRKFQSLLEQHTEWKEQPVIPADGRGMMPGEPLDRVAQQSRMVGLHPEDGAFFDDQSVAGDQLLQCGGLVTARVPDVVIE